MKSSDIAILLSVLSLCVAIWSAASSHQQVQIAHNNYQAAISQALTAQEAYKVSLNALTLQQEEVSVARQVAIVVDEEKVDRLRGPVSNGGTFQIWFRNMSSVSRPYNVPVRGEGIFFNSIGGLPQNSVKWLALDGVGGVALAANQYYDKSFQVWFSSQPPANVTIEVIVNERSIRSFRYRFDPAKRLYVNSD